MVVRGSGWAKSHRTFNLTPNPLSPAVVIHLFKPPVHFCVCTRLISVGNKGVTIRSPHGVRDVRMHVRVDRTGREAALATRRDR